MGSTIRLSGIVEESIVDGEGIRFVLFTQGCPHHCPECHNPATHDFSGGKIMYTADIIEQIKENPLLKGVTFSGGEPFCQPQPLAEMADRIHALGLDITTYTGYTLEQLRRMSQPGIADLLRATDILIDGKFLLAKRDLTLKFRGSSNQRVIDMNATRKTGQITCL